MTVHNGHIERQNWRRVKGKIIARFGTVEAAARIIGCHPNAIRYAVRGLCPRVKAKLKEALDEQ